MNLQEQILEAQKKAMKAKDTLRLSSVRLLRTAVKNREIELRRELTDEEVMQVISSLVKQRRESAQVYRDGGRPELADKEEKELVVLQEFLPAQLTEEEISQLIEAAVVETGALGMKDMGRVMKIVTARTVGRADGRKVSELVRARLA